MMIGKINGIFDKYGKIIFSLFAVLIIMAFMPGLSGLFLGGTSSATVGKCFGESISINQLQLSRDKFATAVALQQGSNPAQMKNRLNIEQFFNILSATKAAQNYGIKVSEKEIADYIYKSTSMQTEGKYDKKKFENYVELYNINKVFLDEGIHDLIIYNKLRAFIQDLAISSDAELLNNYNFSDAQLIIKKAEFAMADYLKDVKIKDEELKTYFEENIVKYMLPKNYKVQLISYAHSDYENKKEITEDELKAYYDKNKEQYKKTPPPIKEGETEKKDIKVEYKSLKDVKENIITSIKSTRSQEAKKVALEKAGKFADKVYDEIQDLPKKNKYKKFQEFAKTEKVNSKITDWFSLDNQKAIDNQPAILNAIEKVDKEIPLTIAIQGSKNAYIAYLIEIKEPTKPELKNVKEEVLSNFKNEKAMALSKEAAAKFANDFSKALTEGTVFNKIKGFEKFTPVNPFSRKSANLNPQMLAMYRQYNIPLPESMQLIKLLNGVKVNEISKVGENAKNGNPIILYFEKETLPKQDNFEQAKDSLKGSKWQIVDKDFTEYLNSNCFLYTNEK